MKYHLIHGNDMRIIMYKTGLFSTKYYFSIVLMNNKLVCKSRRYKSLLDCEEEINRLKYYFNSVKVMKSWEWD